MIICRFFKVFNCCCYFFVEKICICIPAYEAWSWVRGWLRILTSIYNALNIKLFWLTQTKSKSSFTFSCRLLWKCCTSLFFSLNAYINSIPLSHRQDMLFAVCMHFSTSFPFFRWIVDCATLFSYVFILFTPVSLVAVKVCAFAI